MSVDPVVISFQVGDYAIAQLAVCTQTQCRRDFETSRNAVSIRPHYFILRSPRPPFRSGSVLEARRAWVEYILMRSVTTIFLIEYDLPPLFMRTWSPVRRLGSSATRDGLCCHCATKASGIERVLTVLPVWMDENRKCSPSMSSPVPSLQRSRVCVR